MQKYNLTKLQDLLKTGRLHEAKALYSKLLRECKNNDEAWFNLGLINAEAGALSEAAFCFNQVLKLAPQDAVAYFNLGKVYGMQSNLEESIKFYKKAINLRPDFTEAYLNLSNVFFKLNRLQESEACVKNVLKIRPTDVGAYNKLGSIFRAQGKLDAAFDAYQNALRFKPDFYETYCYLGGVLYDQGQIKEAHGMYQKALQLNPNFDSAHWGLAVLLLLEGSFEQCWDSYERRISPLKKAVESLPYPAWDGTSLEGRTILICAEQGVGDEIMFASLLPELIAQEGQIILECDIRLQELLARSFPSITVVGKCKNTEQRLARLSSFSPVDVYISIGSLLRHLRPDILSFPKYSTYLTPDPQRQEFWVNRLTALGNGLKVGISWHGGTADVMQKRSTILEQWRNVLSIPGVIFINLQYGHPARELNAVFDKNGITIHDWDDADSLKDLDDLAAQISALDLIISVDNSTVHMAGALGKKIWTLLPLTPDWRWMLEGEDSHWYPTMRLFRQKEQGKWDTVFDSVARALNCLLK